MTSFDASDVAAAASNITDDHAAQSQPTESGDADAGAARVDSSPASESRTEASQPADSIVAGIGETVGDVDKLKLSTLKELTVVSCDTTYDTISDTTNDITNEKGTRWSAYTTNKDVSTAHHCKTIPCCNDQYVYVGFSRHKILCSIAYTIAQKAIRFRRPDYNPDRAQKLFSSSMSRHLSTHIFIQIHARIFE